MSLPDTITELLIHRNDVKAELREVDQKLASIVMSYEGSLQEALRDGLVRLNFPASSGFYQYLRKRR